MKNPRPNFETPAAPAFRAWLADALERTGLKPATVSRGIGASINLVGAFQRDISRDITLTRAAEIERFLRNAAADLSVKLPTIAEVAKLAGATHARS